MNMLRGPLRLILSVALLWAGMHVCLMPQAQCEVKARRPATAITAVFRNAATEST